MDKDEAAIRQLVSEWSAATQRGDVHAVLNLMTDDVVFLIAGRPTHMRKAEFEAAMHAQVAHAARMTVQSEQQIHEIIIEGDVAYMWSSLQVVMKPLDNQSKPITRKGHTLTVLRKEQGQWRIARDANMLMLQSQE